MLDVSDQHRERIDLHRSCDLAGGTYSVAIALSGRANNTVNEVCARFPLDCIFVDRDANHDALPVFGSSGFWHEATLDLADLGLG